MAGQSMRIGLGRREQIAPGMRFVFVPTRGNEELLLGDPLHSRGNRIEGRVRSVTQANCVVDITPTLGFRQLTQPCRAVLR